ncbi:H-2 class I histocompatibility antigen, Q9 alpha chain-like [Osmerus eperlanus]|uniref:H-2 class I histocompatibility antigen, Q9 alpha chain-like n=1 Tax=Osmerus eperlanus TaxID=29151 RepID=UPI002E0E129B
MKLPFLLFLGIYGAHAVTHSLKYFYTGVSGDINFPEFTTVGLVDEGQFMYFDSNTKTAVPKTEWMKREGAEYWDSQTQGLIGAHQTFKASIQIVKDRFNQSRSTGVHTYQMMCGCELDDDGTRRGYFQYGYDGEDFVSLDQRTLTWTAANQKAVITKLKWDATGAEANILNIYLENTCIEWLQKYVNYGKDTLERKVHPSVSLLQKSPSSPVTCHATGFYPRSVMVFWRRDGDQVYEDVEHGEVLPNEDGTFQNSVHLTVKPEDLDSGRYECVVQLSGVQEDFVTRLENTKRGAEGSGSSGLIIGAVVAVLLLVAIVCGVVIWKKKKDAKKGFAPANTSDDGSNSSNNTAPKA